MHGTFNSIFNKEIDRLRLDISELVYVKLDKGHSYGDLKPFFTRIYAVTKGEGVITYKGREIPMKAGNIYVIPTGLRFRYKCRTELEKLYFHVNLLQYNGNDMFAEMKDVAVIPNRQEEIIQGVYLFERNDMYSVIRLKSWLWDIVAMGLEIAGTEFSSIPKYSPLVEKAIVYVDEHLRSALSVKEIATELYVSESLLQKTFKNEMNIPLGKYITERLYFRAEQEIRLTNRAIKEISAELGFCDPFYFTRCFTQRYSMPPSLYRKSFQTPQNNGNAPANGIS